MALKVTRTQARALQLNLDGGVDDVTPKKRRDNEELRHQTLLFDRRADLVDRYPDLRWLYATLNGVFIPGALLKQVIQAGVIRGVFDVILPVARTDPDGTHYCGVIIEMKRLKNWRPTPEQLVWSAHMAAQGWRAYFCPGAVDAWRCLACYLDISGRDHWAPDLQQQEEYIRLVST